MTKGPNPRVDWVAIRAEYEAGATVSDLARRYDVSRQRISYKAKQEGWSKIGPLATVQSAAASTNATVDVEAETVVLPDQCTSELQGTRFSPERGQTVLNGLVQYGLVGVAAGLAGIANGTLVNWRERSPTFDISCQRALSLRAAKHLRALDKAEDRGDVKASELLLRANRVTRDDFAKDESSTGPARITINITPPPGVAETEEAITIDGTTVNIEGPA